MNLFWFNPVIKNPPDQSDKQVVALSEEYSASEGSEFLDDAIHTEDLPDYSEEVPAAGSLQNL